MSLHQNNKLLLVNDKRCFVSHWPPASEIGMLLVTKLHVTPRGSRNKPNAGRSPTCRRWTTHANSRICRSRATTPVMALRGRFQKGICVAWQGDGMVCVNQTRPHCVNQIGETESKALAERHGRGTAWYV
jgi:hypothetical protein